MIHHQITPTAPLAPHACGHAPSLIEARGRTLTDPRLLGLPARSFHVECCRCGIATAPSWSQATAEHCWLTQANLVPVSRLHALRLQAERHLAAVAA